MYWASFNAVCSSILKAELDSRGQDEDTSMHATFQTGLEEQ